jgi:hypothetical protein
MVTMKPWQDRKSTGKISCVDMFRMAAMRIVIGRRTILSQKVQTKLYLTFSSSADGYLIDVIMSNYVQVLFHLGFVKQFIK